MTRIRASARLLHVILLLAGGVLGLVLVQCWPQRVVRRRWTAYGTRTLARAMLSALHVEPLVVGPRPSTAALYVANHLSWIEVLALLTILPDTRLVSKRDLESWPLLGPLARASGVVFIDRTRRTDVRRVISAMTEALRDGHSVLVFPEGTTSDGETVLPFHSALFETAIRVGAPVVPIGVRLCVVGATRATARTLCWTGDTTLLSHVPAVARVRRSSCVLRLDEALRPIPVDVHCRRARSRARKAIARAARARIERNTQRTEPTDVSRVPIAAWPATTTRATAEAIARVASVRLLRL
ncbi:MAG: 1-acyl-sn-glycerol-3-phosphate acyltransferase [Gemmatimonadaceae bacterium]|nr:1-acyl-sn-glycerol-3-phosphate acyltransferase [Gemmatimonadaceae bacterium]